MISSRDLAFDHSRIIRTAILRMRGKLDYTDLAFGFVEDPSSFTLTELRLIHEAILDHPLDIGNFRRTIKREYEAAGRIEDVSQVVIASQKAEIALQLTLQLRNRAMSAYQEIMRMQV